MSFQGMIFDMGGTLLHFTPAGQTWEDAEKLANRAVYEYLRRLEYTLPPETEALEAAWQTTQETWAGISQADVKSLKLSNVLGLIAGRWGVTDLPTDVYQDLSAAYMGALQPHVRPIDGAVETIHALHEAGFRLALISNTFWPGNTHLADLDRYGLTPYFEQLIFSADVEAWKPNPEVFQLALDAMGLEPEQAAYVGDSLYFDVWGAQQAGLRGVWIEQPDPWLPEGIEVTPDATVRELPELLDVARAWRRERDGSPVVED